LRILDRLATRKEHAPMQAWQGSFYPLGAHYDGSGTNFAVFSDVAERVELCLFDERGNETRLDLPEMTGRVWHGFLSSVGPGQRYGYRVHGPFDPGRGQRCNPHKLLLDPYAKAIDGEVRWDDAVYDQRRGGGERNDTDSAPFVPRSVVVSPYFDWGHDRPPLVPWHKTVIYELHVKGFTARHPGIPQKMRGTFAGLAHPASVDYLRKLGVTAVELMPVHHFLHDHRLVEAGLRNYWGYNSIGYFAPHGEYASDERAAAQVQEFKTMVRTLHRAGIEVILDVVYNHTGEGDHLGPSLCFRGLDNAAYYRLDPHDPGRYRDYTGCGNSLNMRQPFVLQLIMDSLRYWVEEMHVDGFRFDLASALARELHEVDRLSAFFDIIHQDPVIGRVKLIAEPWDLGEGGYQVGRFPYLWSEWNGKYRDTVREFWRGNDQTLPEFANRLTGSSDLYEPTGRRPYASINFVTCHDGFTLRDLVSYDHKHNEANGEDNRDGESHNRSWNCGVEGETEDPNVCVLRGRQQRNFLATLLLSQGVPMLLAGDELGRTQRGNNNAYCHDSELSWIDWDDVDGGLLAFCRWLIRMRKRHPVLRRRRWFHGRPIRGELGDIGWHKPDGRKMAPRDWGTGFTRALGVFLNGDAIQSRDAHEQRIVDDDFYVMFNAGQAPCRFMLPGDLRNLDWARMMDTGGDPAFRIGEPFAAESGQELAGCSMVLLQHRR
jgi:glycogen operon protein